MRDNCKGCNAWPPDVCHVDHFMGSLRVAPSPEHGTSHRILS